MSRTRATRIAVAALAAVFFATPVGLRAVGVTAEPFENRPFAEAPRLSQGWDAFGQATRFLIDRMPLRADAVRLNTDLWTGVFGTEPRYAGQPAADDAALPFAGVAEAAADGDAAAGTAPPRPTVLAGDRGWLFLVEELQLACSPPTPHRAAVRRWARLVRAIRGTGRPAFAVVAPDKTSVYPEHLADDEPRADCARAGKRALWAAVRAADRSDVFGLRDDLVRRKAEHGDALYAPKDTHWTTIGSLSLVDAVLDRVGGPVRLRRGDIVDAGAAPYTGDLTTLRGSPEDGTIPSVAIRRRPGAPRVPGRTLLLGDSFSNAPLPLLKPYFEDLRHLVWLETTPAAAAREIAAADRVIVQTVERAFAMRAVPGAVVDQLADELRAGPR